MKYYKYHWVHRAGKNVSHYQYLIEADEGSDWYSVAFVKEGDKWEPPNDWWPPSCIIGDRYLFPLPGADAKCIESFHTLRINNPNGGNGSFKEMSREEWLIEIL